MIEINRNKFIYPIIGIVLAGIIGDFIHTHVGIPAPSYGGWIEVMSYLTKPLEALGIAIFYYLLGDRLPTNSRFIKGILLGLLLLLAEGELIRQPFMNLLLPNTWREVFLLQMQIWLAHFAMTVIIAFFIKPKYL